MKLFIRSQDRKMIEEFISIKISVDSEIILNNDYVFGSYELFDYHVFLAKDELEIETEFKIEVE